MLWAGMVGKTVPVFEEDGEMGMTEEFSILDLQENTDMRKAAPAYFPDLNLETVMDRLADKWGRDVRKYFLASLAKSAKTHQQSCRLRTSYGEIIDLD